MARPTDEPIDILLKILSCFFSNNQKTKSFYLKQFLSLVMKDRRLIKFNGDQNMIHFFNNLDFNFQLKHFSIDKQSILFLKKKNKKHMVIDSVRGMPWYGGYHHHLALQ